MRGIQSLSIVFASILIGLPIWAEDLSGRWVSSDRAPVSDLKYPDFWMQRVFEIKGQTLKQSYYFYDPKHSEPVLVKEFSGQVTANVKAGAPNLFALDVKGNSEKLIKKADSDLYDKLHIKNCKWTAGTFELMNSQGCGWFPKSDGTYFLTVAKLDDKSILLVGTPLIRPMAIGLATLKKVAE